MTTDETMRQALSDAYGALTKASSMLGIARYELEMVDRDVEAQAAMDAIDHLTSAARLIARIR
jgi:hypothetical protein